MSDPRYSRCLILVFATMDAAMRRSRSVPVTLTLFMLALFGLASLPAAARTAPLLNANEEVAECPDDAAARGQTGSVAKPAAAKRGASSAQSKARPAVRGNDTAPVRAPRWHQFVPGMFR
jgi:hypothetical protein